MMESYFKKLNSINVNDHTEQKGKLTYLSWAWAWAKAKENFPDATYNIYENKDGFFYHTDGKTCWVKTGVTINNIENVEYLPVMDYKNNSISIADVTSVDINKTIQRSLTKALARHGLGLYIYAGEDLPDDDRSNQQPTNMQKQNDFSERKVTPTDPAPSKQQSSSKSGKQITDQTGAMINEHIKKYQSLTKLTKNGIIELICKNAKLKDASELKSVDENTGLQIITMLIRWEKEYGATQGG